MSDDRLLIPKIDWTPSPFARIDPEPPRPRSYGQSTMSDEDYAKAQEQARDGFAPPGILRDWGGPDPDERPPEHSRPHPAIPHPGADQLWLPERDGGLKDPL